MRFNLQMYNLPNPEKLDKKSERKRLRIEAKNEKRRTFNAEHPNRPERKMKDIKPARYWLREVIGEAPVLVDSSLIENSVN